MESSPTTNFGRDGHPMSVVQHNRVALAASTALISRRREAGGGKCLSFEHAVSPDLRFLTSHRHALCLSVSAEQPLVDLVYLLFPTCPVTPKGTCRDRR